MFGLNLKYHEFSHGSSDCVCGLRMGRFKPLLPFGDHTAVEIVIRAFVNCRVAPVIGGGGYRLSDLEKVVTK